MRASGKVYSAHAVLEMEERRGTPLGRMQALNNSSENHPLWIMLVRRIRGVPHCSLHKAIKKRNGECCIAMRGTVDHSFSDKRIADWRDCRDLLTQLICDIA